MRRLQLASRYDYLRDFILGLPDRMETDGVYIYGGRRNLIKMFTAPDGIQLNVKQFKKPAWPNSLIYSYGLRSPKGQRAYDYPARLLEKGIETPEAVAYIEDRNALGILQKSWFVSLQCPYGHRLYEFGEAQEGHYEEVAQALGTMVAEMHDKGCLHEDLSPGNVLWEASAQGIHFSLVDINRMHFGTVSMKKGCRNFSRLWGPKRFYQIMIEAYAHRRGFDTDKCLQLAYRSRARFWQHYLRSHEQVPFPLEL